MIDRSLFFHGVRRRAASKNWHGYIVREFILCARIRHRSYNLRPVHLRKYEYNFFFFFFSFIEFQRYLKWTNRVNSSCLSEKLRKYSNTYYRRTFTLCVLYKICLSNETTNDYKFKTNLIICIEIIIVFKNIYLATNLVYNVNSDFKH